MVWGMPEQNMCPLLVFRCFGTPTHNTISDSSLSFSSLGKPLVKTSRVTVLNTEKPAITMDIGGTIRTVRGVNVTINCQVAGKKSIHVLLFSDTDGALREAGEYKCKLDTNSPLN